MIRPTTRAVVLFGAILPLSLLLSLAAPGSAFAGLGALAAATLLLGLDLALAIPRRLVRVEPEAPRLLYVGDGDDLIVRLSAPPRYGRIAVDVACDVGPGLEAPPTQSVLLDPAGPVEIAVPLVPERRGTARIDSLWVRWRGPLGLMSRQTRLTLDIEIPVVPNVRSVRHAAVNFASIDALFGVKAQTQQGDGTEFEALRDYMAGLDHRSIDWKHSARHRKLVCKEYRSERNHPIILAFDTGHLMSEPLDGIPRLDHAINAGLLIGYVSLRAGDRIGMHGFDSGVRLYLEPTGGMHSFARIQRASAGLEYRRDETNFTLGLTDLLSRLRRRSLVILMTDFVDTVTAELMVENVARLASRHLVLFVSLRDPLLTATVERPPTSFRAVTRTVIADAFIRERRVVFERLRRLGVHCLEAPSDRIGVDMVNRYLDIKRQELI